MARNRMTWNQARRASAPPAIPGYDDAGYKHPANQSPDPDPDKYENGDTSSWAEDVHPAPYPNSRHPAVPTEAGGYNHPAGNPANLKQAMYRKAYKCIRIAQTMLGPKAPVAQIENKALLMLDWPEKKVQASLKRIAQQRRACGETGMYGMYDDPDMDMGISTDVYGDADMDEDMDLYGMDDAEMGMDELDDTELGMDDAAELGMFDENEGMFDEDFDDEGEDFDDDMYGMLDDYEQLDPVMGPQRMASKEDKMLAQMLRQARAKKQNRFAGLDATEKRMLAEMLRQAADEGEAEDEEVEEVEEKEEGAKKKARTVRKAVTTRRALQRIRAAEKDEEEGAEDEEEGAEDEVEEKEEGAKKKKARTVRKAVSTRRPLLRRRAADEDEEEGAEDEEEGAEDEDEVEVEEKEEGAKKKARRNRDLDPMGLMDDPMDRLARKGEDAELRALFNNDLFAAADRVAAEEGAEDEEESAEDEEEEIEEKEEGAKKKARSRKTPYRRAAEEEDDEEDDEEEDDVEEEDDDVEEEEEEGAKKKATRLASTQRPRPRKPARSGSPRRLGNIHTAASAGEINELSKLWDTAPEVSETFGITATNLDLD